MEKRKIIEKNGRNDDCRRKKGEDGDERKGRSDGEGEGSDGNRLRRKLRDRRRKRNNREG